MTFKWTKKCLDAKIDEAYDGMSSLYSMGYSASDIITIMFRVVKNYSSMNEFLKLEYIKVREEVIGLEAQDNQHPFFFSAASIS